MAAVHLDLNINKHRSPTICEPWNTSFSILINCPNVATYESPHVETATNPTSTPMETDQQFLLRSPVKADDDHISPSLEYPRARLYQAYCVTEASSRPPSPDTLIPPPLRIRPSTAREREIDTRYSLSKSILDRTTTIVDQDTNLAMPPEEANVGDGPPASSNDKLSSGNTILADRHHIAQAVTPRGRNPLKTTETKTYDATPSHFRMQQIAPKYVATSIAYQRKALPQNNSNSGMDHHPLPPLPIEIAPTACFDDPIVESQTLQSHGDFSEQTWQEPEFRSQSRNASPISERFSNNSRNSLGLNIPAINAPSGVELLNAPKASAIPSINLHPRGFQTQYEDVSTPHSSLRPQPRNVGPRQSQLESSEELYISRGLLSEMEDDRCAHRRTQPKDAKLKYQFGRRPSVRLDNIPPPIPPHVTLPKSLSVIPPKNDNEYSRSNYYVHQPLLPPYLDTHTSPGPRPPPWGSHDDLELKRQTRSDAREREDARKYRLTADSGSSDYKGSDSTVSLPENPLRREVEEYREQVLRLYPDLEFDGSAGQDGRSCCFCMVM
jgi:hypothetical protein